MKSPSPVIHHVSDDADDLQYAVRDWDLDFRPIERAKGDSWLLQTVDATAQLAWMRLAPRVDQRGASPPGMRTFGLLARDAPELVWCGIPVDTDTLMFFDAGGDFESSSPAGFEVHTLSLYVDRFDDLAHELGMGPVARLGGSPRAVPLRPEQANRLRGAMEASTRRIARDPSAAGADDWRDTLQYDLGATMLRALLSSPDSPSSPPRGAVGRQVALRRALDFIDGNAQRAPRIAELCSAADASERTIRYAFRERFGVSPKAYLQAVRLNGVRRELRDRGDGTTVSGAANRWAFWHMGQFAADYRALFGELPSETLAAQRGRARMVSVRSPSSAQRRL